MCVCVCVCVCQHANTLTMLTLIICDFFINDSHTDLLIPESEGVHTRRYVPMTSPEPRTQERLKRAP